METSGAAAPFFGDFVGKSRICERVVKPPREGETFESGGAAELTWTARLAALLLERASPADLPSMPQTPGAAAAPEAARLQFRPSNLLTRQCSEAPAA